MWFDHMITVCDNVREASAVFFGVVERLHHSFDDLAALDAL